MKNIKLLLISFIIAITFSCSSDETTNNIPLNTDTDSNRTLYVVGHTNIDSRNVATLWINNTTTLLPSFPDTQTEAREIVIDGNDIHILGVEYDNNDTHTNSKIVYWKNGIITRISDGFIGGYNDIGLIINNHNVYILGRIYDGPNVIYKYWKNGVPTTVFTASSGSIDDMTIVNDDVYMAGNSNDGFTVVNKAQYWKNGVLINITDGTNNAITQSISIEGSEVSVLFLEHNPTTNKNDLKVWKNGTVSLLGASNFTGKKIIIKDNVTHVIGIEYKTFGDDLVYWRDGVKTTITEIPNSYHKPIMKIVDNNNVYIAYNTLQSPSTIINYWKNGVNNKVNYSGPRLESLFVFNNDIYTVGDRYSVFKNKTVAKTYGTGLSLSDIFVTD